MARRKFGILGAAVALIAAYVTSVVASAWPWHSEPDAALVAQRWKFVEAAVTIDPEAFGDPALFEKVNALSRAAWNDMKAVEKQKVTDWAEFPPSIRAANDALIEWSNGSGAVLRNHCDRAPQLVDVYKLATLTLDALHGPVSPPIIAIAHFSRAMRRSGTIVMYTIGVSLSDALRRWAEREKIAPNELFRSLKAMPRELEAASARDALCMDHYFTESGPAEDRTRWQDPPVLALTPDSPLYAPWHARRFVNMAREQKMVRLYLGGEFARCASQADDFVAYASCRQPDLNRMPKSVGVRLTVPYVAGSIATNLNAYSAFLDRR